MKYILASILLLLLTCGYCTAQSWMGQTSNTDSELTNIIFFDNNNGWAFGDSLNYVLHTTNQGETWSTQSLGSYQYQILSSVTFSSSSCIAVGKFRDTGDGVVLATTNSGSSWIANTSIAERLYDVAFIDETTGFIVGRRGYLAKTTDGGSTWNTVTIGTDEDLLGINFANENKGVVIGANRTILYTIDAGSTWNFSDTSGLPMVNYIAIKFVNSSIGHAIGDGGTILTTTDNGSTWTSTIVPFDLTDISFVDPNIGWVVGKAGTVLYTADAGSTWDAQTSGTTEDINSISINSVNLGWYCGKSGTIYRYGWPTSIESNSTLKHEFSIHPNPGNGKFIVKLLNNNDPIFKIKLFTILGDLVDEYKVDGLFMKKFEMDLSNHPVGTYLFQIQTDRDVLTRKIILTK